MANTSYLTKVVEPHLVQWLSIRIGVALAPRRLLVGHRADGSPAHFAFDGVSPDGKTAVLVSTSFTLKAGGERKLFVDAAVLLKADLKARVMVFVSPHVMEHFVNRCDGLLELKNIEMVLAPPLSAEMKKRIEEIQVVAKREVGDKGKKTLPGGRRR